MESLVIHAVNLQSALGFCEALSSFKAKLVEGENGRYQVEIPLSGDREVISALNAIEGHVTQRREAGPAHLELGGRNYTLHPDPE